MLAPHTVLASVAEVQSQVPCAILPAGCPGAATQLCIAILGLPAGAPRVSRGGGADRRRSRPAPLLGVAREGGSPPLLRSSPALSAPLPAAGAGQRPAADTNIKRPRLDETYMPKKKPHFQHGIFFSSIFFLCVCLSSAAAEDGAGRGAEPLPPPPLPPAAASPQRAPGRRRPQRMAQEEQHCSSPLGCEA